MKTGRNEAFKEMKRKKNIPPLFARMLINSCVGSQKFISRNFNHLLRIIILSSTICSNTKKYYQVLCRKSEVQKVLTDEGRGEGGRDFLISTDCHGLGVPSPKWLFQDA